MTEQINKPEIVKSIDKKEVKAYFDEWRKVVKDSRLARSELAIMFMLQDQDFEDYDVFFSYRKIAQKIGVSAKSKNHIGEKLNKLEEYKYVELFKETGDTHNGKVHIILCEKLRNPYKGKEAKTEIFTARRELLSEKEQEWVEKKKQVSVSKGIKSSFPSDIPSEPSSHPVKAIRSSFSRGDNNDTTLTVNIIDNLDTTKVVSLTGESLPPRENPSGSDVEDIKTDCEKIPPVILSDTMREFDGVKANGKVTTQGRQISQLIRFFKNVNKYVTGFEYYPNRAKDTTFLKQLLMEGMSPDDIKLLMAYLFHYREDNEYCWKDSSGTEYKPMTIGLFRHLINDLNVKIYKEREPDLRKPEGYGSQEITDEYNVRENQRVKELEKKLNRWLAKGDA